MFLLTHQMLWWCLTLWHKVHSFSHYVCSGTFSIVISFGLPFLVDIPLRKLKQILHKLKLQSFLGNGCEIDVSYVRGVRDWKGWLLGYALCFEIRNCGKSQICCFLSNQYVTSGWNLLVSTFMGVFEMTALACIRFFSSREKAGEIVQWPVSC